MLSLRVATIASCLLAAHCSAQISRLTLTPVAKAPWEEVRSKDIPTASALRLKSAPAVDGNVSDPVWEATEPIAKFRELNNVPPDASEWVRVRFGHTKQALYLAAELAYPGETLDAQVDQNYGKIWHDDCLEIFLFVKGTDTRYQVDINALGKYWAGAHKQGLNWKPSLSAAAAIGERRWTVELGVPWTALGVSAPEATAIALQVRYMVNDQSGWVAWVDGNDPREYGRLVIAEDAAKAGEYVRVRRMLFPRRLPAGVNQVGLELENPSDRARKAMVRVCRYSPRAAETTEYVDVPPKAIQQVLLPMTVPAEGEIHRLLVFKDMHSKPLQFVEARRIRTLDPLAVSLSRERFWAGDREVKGSIALGLTQDVLPQTTLKAELWGRKALISEALVSPVSARRYDLALRLAGLSPASHRLFVAAETPKGSHEVVRDIEIKQSEPLPRRRRVALDLNWPEGAWVSGSVPLYAGVSFPGGMLMDPAQVRVVDGRSRPVICQTEPLARWSPAGSVRWLGTYFSGERGRSYFIEFGSDVRQAKTVRGVRVDEQRSAFVIDTGTARFEIPKSGPLFGRAWVGGRPVLAGGTACLILADQKGRAGDETRGGMEEAPVLEVAGPARVIVKREGLYRTAAGERLGKYVVRLTFAPGCAFVPIQHTFINTEDTNQIQYSGLALRVKPAFGGEWQVQLDNEKAHTRRAWSGTLAPAKGDAAHLCQLVHRHHFQPESRYEIRVRRGRGPWERQDQGELAGEWGRASADGLGVALTIRNLAETFPKEIEIGPDGMTAHLWSSRGRRDLDYRASTLVDFWGEEWFERYPGGAAKARSLYSNAQGTARTHDLCLHVYETAATAPDQVAAVAQLADAPILTVQDPAWLAETDALGPIHPYDPESFPKVERYGELFFRELLVEQAERAGDFGFLDYGSGPHTYPNTYPGKARPRFYRYSAIDYHGRTAAWLAYARSNDRQYFDYADAFNRNLNDYRLSYWGARKRPLGARLGGGVSHDTPLYWGGVPTFFGHQGSDFNNYYYQFYLTGNRRVVDGLKLWTDWAVREFDPAMAVTISGMAHVPYWQLAQVYYATWDERVAERLDATRDRLLDLRTSTGLADLDYYGATYKFNTAGWAPLNDWIATGSSKAKQALLKICEHLLYSVPDSRPGYQDHSGAYAAYAYRLTGDPRYPGFAAARLGGIAFRYVGDDNELKYGRGYMAGYTGPWNSNVMETLAYGLRPVAEARASSVLPAWPAAGTGQTFCFTKEPHEPVSFLMTFGAGMDLSLVSVLDRKHETRRGYFVGPVYTGFRRQYFTKAAPGLAGGEGPLTLPPETLPGEYHLTDATITWTDARELVSLIPEGAYLGAQTAWPRQWFFMVPKGKRGAIATNGRVVLHQGDRRHELVPGRWSDLAAGEEDTLYTVEARGRPYVRFKGDIPPVLAEVDPGRFFIPKRVPRAAPIGPRETPDALFVTGVTAAAGDQALLLNGTRDLRLPRGERVSEWAFEYFDCERGTLEFWFKPQWTSRLETEERRRNVIDHDAWYLKHAVVMEEGLRGHEKSGFHFLAIPRRGNVNVIPDRKYNHSPIDQGRWYHLALCWDTIPNKGWVSQLYIDGRPGTPVSPGDFRLARFAAMEDRDPANWRVAPLSRPLTLKGEFDAVIDEVRISSVVRYPTDFVPDPRKRLTQDDRTLLLLRLDGDVSALALNDRPGLKAALRQ